MLGCRCVGGGGVRCRACGGMRDAGVRRGGGEGVLVRERLFGGAGGAGRRGRGEREGDKGAVQSQGGGAGWCCTGKRPENQKGRERASERGAELRARRLMIGQGPIYTKTQPKVCGGRRASRVWRRGARPMTRVYTGTQDRVRVMHMTDKHVCAPGTSVFTGCVYTFFY